MSRGLTLDARRRQAKGYARAMGLAFADITHHSTFDHPPGLTAREAAWAAPVVWEGGSPSPDLDDVPDGPEARLCRLCGVPLGLDGTCHHTNGD